MAGKVRNKDEGWGARPERECGNGHKKARGQALRQEMTMEVKWELGARTKADNGGSFTTGLFHVSEYSLGHLRSKGRWVSGKQPKSQTVSKRGRMAQGMGR